MYKICVSSKIDLVSRFLNRSKAKEREVGIEEQKYAREHEFRKSSQKTTEKRISILAFSFCCL